MTITPKKNCLQELLTNNIIIQYLVSVKPKPRQYTVGGKLGQVYRSALKERTQGARLVINGSVLSSSDAHIWPIN